MEVIRVNGRKASIVMIFFFTAVMLAAQSKDSIGAPGYIGLKKADGIWYFTAPDGKLFLSKGVNLVQPRDDAVKPGSRGYNGLGGAKSVDTWVKETAALFRSWGFNTMGCWSHDATRNSGLYFTPVLYVRIERDRTMKDVFADVFAEEAVRVARQTCALYLRDKNVLGYFLENEQPWYGDYGWYTGHDSTVLDAYMGMPAGTAGKTALVGFYRDRYKEISALNAAYLTDFASWDALASARAFPANVKPSRADRLAFVGLVADRYYRTVTEAVREADPNHLILGDRLANAGPREVVAACGKYCDVVSLNYYSGYLKIEPGYLKGAMETSGKPILITEFSYCATENRSGNLNSKGALALVKTQKDRGDGFTRYVSALVDVPFIVGYHWFQFYDESPGGRSFDGEDSNYGILDIDGRPYEALVDAMRKTNAAAEDLHAKSAAVTGTATYVDDPPAVHRSIFRAIFPADFSSPLRAAGYSDTAKGGRVSISVQGGEVIADYDTGTGWGCGMTILPGVGNAAETGYADVSAYQRMEVTLTIPSGLRFLMYLNEQGTDAPGKTAYAGRQGSDGETYSIGDMLGGGSRQVIRFSFDELGRNSGWGNQNGNHTIDLQAIMGIDITILGNQGKGRLIVHRCRLF
jgi:hypothetical protein